MAGGGGRPRCSPGALLSVAAVVVVARWVRAEQKEEQSIDLIRKNEVYGDTRHEVNVYVKVFTNSPFLVCMDLALSQERIIDPNYLWTGPDGRDLQGQSYVNLTETGKLMVMGFMVSMSGAYTCTLSHKVIETTTQEETEMVEAYKFMVYAYREAEHAYQVSVRFSTTGCRLRNNGLFIEVLKKILNGTISHLTCHITESSYKCHSIRTPKNGLQYELFVNFLVNPFAPGWEEVCHEVLYDCEDVTNRRVRQVLCQSPRVFSASLAPTSSSAPADMTGSRANWEVFPSAEARFEARVSGCSYNTVRGQQLLHDSHRQLSARFWEKPPHPPELRQLLRGL
ncbi:zona pellucida-binding protein 2 isoform X2 [Taeniopygia guttata]|uniref:zona pellucida-binding protein 2 isoform X2 n=1 Tax=Taeniopygia guttata TaxID=59729 RepID=UPI003BB88CA3